MKQVEINGYKYPYRISEEAVVEKQLVTGRWRVIRSYVSRSLLKVKLIRTDGTRHSVAVKSLMRDAFLGGERKGYCLTHKNDMVSDCELCNLMWVKRYAVNARIARKNQRPVAKIDKYGNILALYKSMTEAAHKNYVSTSSVSYRCNNKLQNPFKAFGYSFRFEE